MTFPNNTLGFSYQLTPATIQKEKNISSKELAEAQKIMDIAKERGMDIKQILAHNVLSASTLFDGDLPDHVNKSTLVGEIEPKLDLTQWHRKSTRATQWHSCCGRHNV